LVSKSLQQGSAPVAQSASLEVVVWGFGPRVVLVHGSVFNGPLTWKEQQPLGERWRLEVLNRRGYGKSPPPAVIGNLERIECPACEDTSKRK